MLNNRIRRIISTYYTTDIESLSFLVNCTSKVLQEITTLPLETVQQIVKIAAEIIVKNKFLTADQIPDWERISTGCSSIDSVTRGGIPVNGITEIVGCSGVGKTQICLQLAIMVQTIDNKPGAVYICTEDIFPSKRFHQLSRILALKYNLEDTDLGSNVFLEHIGDVEQLRRCLSVHLQNLLSKRCIKLIVIDSIAGLFRSENVDANYANRSQELTAIAHQLRLLSDRHKLAIITVNQVTDNIESGSIEACLGLAWSNLITSRFCVTRFNQGHIREFEIVFAPDLPTKNCQFVITEGGVCDIE